MRRIACLAVAVVLMGACGGGGAKSSRSTTTAARTSADLAGTSKPSNVLAVPVPVEAVIGDKGSAGSAGGLAETWYMPAGTTLAQLKAFFDHAMPPGAAFAGYKWCGEQAIGDKGDQIQRLYWKTGSGHYLTVVYGFSDKPGIVIGEDEESDTGCSF